jgi:hypothetical protein
MYCFSNRLPSSCSFVWKSNLGKKEMKVNVDFSRGRIKDDDRMQMAGEGTDRVQPTSATNADIQRMACAQAQLGSLGSRLGEGL